MEHNGTPVAVYRGCGHARDLTSTMEYFRTHHPEAARVLAEQEQEMRKHDCQILSATDPRPEPFKIAVIRFARTFAVTAPDFETEYFASDTDARHFAENEFEPFIRNRESKMGVVKS